MKIEGKTFFITGGASGLGEGCVRHFVSLGANVAIADLNKKNGEAIVKELGNKTIFVHCNVAVEKSVIKAFETTVNKFGEVNGVFNIAGVSAPRRVLSKSGKIAPLSTFKKTIDINLIGTFNVLRIGAKAMSNTSTTKNEDKGVIINVASIAAFDGQIGQAAYSASKSGVVGMTLPIARDLSIWGIRICTIAPGMFKTALTSMMPKSMIESLTSQIQFPKRFGIVKEFAFLCEHIVKNQYLNGEVIRLDGAIRMAPK